MTKTKIINIKELSLLLSEGINQYIQNCVKNNLLVFTPNLHNQINQFLNNLKRSEGIYYFLDINYNVHYIKNNTLDTKTIDNIIKQGIQFYNDSYNTNINNYNYIKINLVFDDIQNSL